MRSTNPPEELSKLHFGQAVETRAWKWYAERHPGAQLLEHGYRWRGGEIDLVVEQPVRRAHDDPAGDEPRGRELVFIEVRARLPGAWVGGIESVGPGKLRRLERGVELYLARYRGAARSVRLDLMAWDGECWEHRPNALVR